MGQTLAVSCHSVSAARQRCTSAVGFVRCSGQGAGRRCIEVLSTVTSLGPQLGIPKLCINTPSRRRGTGQWPTAPVTSHMRRYVLMTVQTCLVGESPAMRPEWLMRHLESTVPVSPLTKVSEQAHEALLDDVASQTYEEAPSSARAVTDWSL